MSICCVELFVSICCVELRCIMAQDRELQQLPAFSKSSGNSLWPLQAATADILAAPPWAIIHTFCSLTDLSALVAASQAFAKGRDVHSALFRRRAMAAAINAAVQRLGPYDALVEDMADRLFKITWTFKCVQQLAAELARGAPVRKHTLHDVPRMLETKFPLMLDTSGVLFCSAESGVPHWWYCTVDHEGRRRGYLYKCGSHCVARGEQTPSSRARL